MVVKDKVQNAGKTVTAILCIKCSGYSIHNPFKEVYMSTDINRGKYSIVISIQTAAVHGAPDWAFALVQYLYL